MTELPARKREHSGGGGADTNKRIRNNDPAANTNSTTPLFPIATPKQLADLTIPAYRTIIHALNLLNAENSAVILRHINDARYRVPPVTFHVESTCDALRTLPTKDRRHLSDSDSEDGDEDLDADIRDDVEHMLEFRGVRMGRD
jgi:hypothetical protein